VDSQARRKHEEKRAEKVPGRKNDAFIVTAFFPFSPWILYALSGASANQSATGIALFFLNA